ncbi:MAG: response regulator transcription factor [Lachnospiraceae bacterium]|nr:response regulator transcription factor [Lachnospiraceae bacterium]
MYNILICDDEKDIVNALKIYLSSPDLNFYEAENGAEALSIIHSNEIHLVILDIMMPKLNGIEALSKIREFSNIPVIMLSAKSEDTDKILGLNIGADDYITKPFNPIEVNARVRSALRRYFDFGGRIKSEDVYACGGVTLDDIAKTVTVDSEEVTLTPKEFDILKLLMRSPGKVFSPKEIYEKIWDESMMAGCEKTVAVHIRHIREKIEINPNEPRYLKVIWGQGYKIEGQ